MRSALVLIAALACTAGAPAQTGWRAVAVPYYTPPAFVQGFNAHWALPRAREFSAVSTVLARVTGDYCRAQPASPSDDVRTVWRTALAAWAQLGTVAAGPLATRRSARQIDFQPVRPALLARAIDTQPVGTEAMAQIGGPAKGFPALEALLWPKPVAPGTPACAYAVQVADDIHREAQALAAAFQAAASAELDDSESVAAMSEAVNQWLGGLDALRLQGIERPLRDKGRRAPRAASGAAAAERAARWQALETLAVLEGAEAPAPGAGLVPLEPYLRGKGLNPLADRLAAAVQVAGRALGAAGNNAPARMKAAAAALTRLTALVENEVAPALDIRLGFSDADGD